MTLESAFKNIVRSARFYRRRKFFQKFGATAWSAWEAAAVLTLRVGCAGLRSMNTGFQLGHSWLGGQEGVWVNDTTLCCSL